MNDKKFKTILYEITERVEDAVDEANERVKEEEALEGAYYTLVDRLNDLIENLIEEINNLVIDINSVVDEFESDRAKQ